MEFKKSEKQKKRDNIIDNIESIIHFVIFFAFGYIFYGYLMSR